VDSTIQGVLPTVIFLSVVHARPRNLRVAIAWNRTERFAPTDFPRLSYLPLSHMLYHEFSHTLFPSLTCLPHPLCPNPPPHYQSLPFPPSLPPSLPPPLEPRAPFPCDHGSLLYCHEHIPHMHHCALFSLPRFRRSLAFYLHTKSTSQKS
jgi:hypothetical protein